MMPTRFQNDPYRMSKGWDARSVCISIRTVEIPLDFHTSTKNNSSDVRRVNALVVVSIVVAIVHIATTGIPIRGIAPIAT